MDTLHWAERQVVTAFCSRAQTAFTWSSGSTTHLDEGNETLATAGNVMRLLPKRVIALMMLGALISVLLATPTLLSKSGLATNLLSSSLSNHRCILEAESIQVGWFTESTIKGLSLTADKDASLRVGVLRCDLSLLEWLTAKPEDGLQLYARDVELRSPLEKGVIPLWNEIQSLQADPNGESMGIYQINVENASAWLVETDTGKPWRLDKANLIIGLDSSHCEAKIDGVFTDLRERNGSLTCETDYRFKTIGEDSDSKEKEAEWNVALELDSLPLTAIELTSFILPNAEISNSDFVNGDATGNVDIRCNANQETEIRFSEVQLRDVTIRDNTEREWTQQLAVVNGFATWTDEIFQSENLSLATDIGQASMEGRFSLSSPLSDFFSPNDQLIDPFDGSVTIDINLPALTQSLPHLLPVKEGTQLKTGRVHGKLKSGKAGQQWVTSVELMVDEMTAITSSGENFSVAPNTVNAKFVRENETIRAEQFDWKSKFGSASGKGDAQEGSLRFQMDLEDLTQYLSPLLDLDDWMISGDTTGDITWHASNEGQWLLDGSFQANDLSAPGTIVRNQELTKVVGRVSATGALDSAKLKSLSKLDLTLDCDQTVVHCQLAEPIPNLNEPPNIYLNWSSKGELSLLDSLKGALDLKNPLEGNYQASGKSVITDSEIFITESFAEIFDFQTRVADSSFREDLVQLELSGSYHWNDHHWLVHDFTLSSHSVSLRAKGKHDALKTEYELQWRTLLDRLSDSFSDYSNPLDQSELNQIRQPSQGKVSILGGMPKGLSGDAQGSLFVKHTEDFSQYEVDLQIDNLAIPHLTRDRDLIAGRNEILKSVNENQDMYSLWTEPSVSAQAVLHRDHHKDELIIDQIDFVTDWIQTSVHGTCTSTEPIQTLSLTGSSDWDITELSSKIQPLIPIVFQVTGDHQSNIQLEASLSDDGLIDFSISTDIGWDSAEVAGMSIAGTTIPLLVSPNAISIKKSRLPVGGGTLVLAGSLHQLENETWIQLEPGVLGEEIEITPEMSKQWLRFITPLLADATKIEGLVGIKFDEARINLVDSSKTKIRGSMNLDSVKLIAGPLTNQLIRTIETVKAIRMDPSAITRSDKPSTLIELPTQTVGFAIANRVVAHERLQASLDRAQLITTGQVTFDGQLYLTAMIPLDPKWLGSDLQRLAGQTLQLPIIGTLDRPTLDTANLQSILTQLGVQAIQNDAESFLEDQINRGLNKLFGN